MSDNKSYETAKDTDNEIQATGETDEYQGSLQKTNMAKPTFSRNQDPEVNDEDSSDTDEVSDWMTPEEEDKKIIEVLREIAVRCTHANPEKRPTSFQVLEMLYKVYTPPERSFSFRRFFSSLYRKGNKTGESSDGTASEKI